MKQFKKQRMTPITQIKPLVTSLFDTKVEKRKKWIVLGILLYIVSPIDLVPDFIPVVGYADDILIPILLIIAERVLSKNQKNIVERAEKEAERFDS